MKAYIPIISGALSGVIIFIVLFSYSMKHDDFIFFRIASRIIGRAPEPGDGAFQFPIGWFLMLIFSGAVAIAVTVLIKSLEKKS